MTSKRKTRSAARRPLVARAENDLLRELSPEDARLLKRLRKKERKQGRAPQ